MQPSMIRFVLPWDQRTAERRTAVRTGIAQYAGVAVLITECDEVDTEHPDLRRACRS